MPKQQRMPTIPPVTAVDELGTIKEVLILNLLMTVFDRDTKVLQESNLKTKQPYIDLVQRAMDAVAADLARLRNRLRMKGIKLTDMRRDAEGVGCVYWCRGYKASFGMLWHFAKAETEVRMRKYLGEDIRKYVRNDLPEHLQPKWLLCPAGEAGNIDKEEEPDPRLSRTAPVSYKHLDQGDHTDPDKGSSHPE